MSPFRLGASKERRPRRAPSTWTQCQSSVRDRTCIMTVSDCDEEVRQAVRAVINAARTGTPLDRIAILHTSPEPYARLAHEQLSAAGIAFNGAATVPLTARVAGRTLLQMFALPEGGFRREDVFAWLAGARLRAHGHFIPITAWERVSRDAGVVGGREHWDRLLATFADECDGSADTAEGDPDAPPWRAEQLRENADRARGLREFVLGLIDDLTEAAARPRSWGERAEWARRYLDELLGGEGRRISWPPAEQKGVERLERALDRLTCLDSVEPSVGLDVFTRTLELELECDLGRVGRMGRAYWSARRAWASASISISSWCSDSQKGSAPHRRTMTRFCPTTNAKPLVANFHFARSASNASIASCSPPWPVRRTRSCACPAATCVATSSESHLAGSCRLRAQSPGSVGGLTNSSAQRGNG
jgi:hypothetical protein